jgi:hypothetical protein
MANENYVEQAAPNFGAASGNAARSSCSGGSAAGTFGGTVVNNGLGIILYGNGTLTNSRGTTCLQMNWFGNGSANVGSLVPTNNSPAGSGSAAPPAIVPQVTTTFSCSSNCSGRILSPAKQTINVPQGQPFANHNVSLVVNANWTGSPGTLTVDVPQDSSIHINAPIVAPPSPPPATGAPTLSDLMLMVTGLGLAALGATYAQRLRRT